MDRRPQQDTEILEWQAAFERRSSRAPAAMAAATLIMAAGAVFIASFARIEAGPGEAASEAPAEIAAISMAAPSRAPAPAKADALIAVNFGDGPSLKPQTLKPEAKDSELQLASTSQKGHGAGHEVLPLNPNAPHDARQKGALKRAAKKLVQQSTERGFWPSLKPSPATSGPQAAPTISPALTRPMTFGGFAIASIDDNPPPVFFAQDLKRDRTPPPPLAVAMSTDIAPAPQRVTVKLSRGENFVDALKRAGVRAADRNAAAAAFSKVQNIRRLRPGQKFELTTAAPNQTMFQLASAGGQAGLHLLGLDFRVDAQNRIGVRRRPDGVYDAIKSEIPLTKRIASIEGRIEGSLFVSAKKAGAPSQVIGNFANMFAYDVDFQRDIFGGDEFEAIFEVYYDDEGRIVSAGDILYGRLKWRGRNKEKGYYRFAAANGGAKADFYDRAGQSAKRLLMKTPIDGARLSSGFGTRKHPILGYRKAHKGVDFAARRGTPIYAAGDGVVERANRYGSFGNYIRIRHANGYKTAYAHLKGFRRGIRSGRRVEQGDVIGYVGTTGRSTGPHLHYEVHYKGKAVNPQKLKIATGVQLKSGELDRFKIMRNEIDAMRMPPNVGTGLYAEEEASRRKAL